MKGHVSPDTHIHTNTPNKRFFSHLIINSLSFYRKKSRTIVNGYTELGEHISLIPVCKVNGMLGKFSSITSFSKGLIGYSLRYSREREAAVCMSGVVGRVEGVQGSGGVVQGRS